MITTEQILTSIRTNDLTFLKNNLSELSHINQVLHQATIDAKDDVIDLLCAQDGFDVNIVNNDNWNVLHQAAYLCDSVESKHFQIYKQLLEKGVDPRKKNNQLMYCFQMHPSNQEVDRELWELTKPYLKQPIIYEQSKNITIGDESIVAFLFCGQGTQRVGMLSSYKHDSFTKKLNEIAKEELGYDLLDICINGPKERLNCTDVSQPALLLSAVTKHHTLLKTEPLLLPSVCAGFSLGEYSALVVSGALTFRDAIRLLKVRGEAMMRSCRTDSGGMLSVIGLDNKKIQQICEEVGVSVANYLFPKGRVLTGRKTNIKAAEKLAKTMGALEIRHVIVSGGFHSECMYGGINMLDNILSLTQIKMPKCIVLSNVTAQPYTSVEEIKHLLLRQLLSPVLWEQSMHTLIDMKVERYVELGEGDELKHIMQRIDESAWERCD